MTESSISYDKNGNARARVENTKRGRKIAEVLQLRPDHENRYRTTWGTKTDLGLYHTINRIMNDPLESLP